MAPVLNPFHRFTSEGAAVGRLLLGYSNLEIDLMNCVQMACGGNLNTVIKAMFGARGEAKRIRKRRNLVRRILRIIIFHRTSSTRLRSFGGACKSEINMLIGFFGTITREN
jgi:hypothetical protein